MNREVLPKNLKPIKYELFLKPDLNNFTFDGSLNFTFEVLEKTSKIILNSKELTISKCFLNNNIINNYEFEIETERVIFNIDEKLDKGTYNLKVEYQGILNDQMAGFYRSKYLDGDKEKYLATTQFEAVDARRAFPCMDEPEHKAIFQINLTIPKGLTGLSNTEIIKEVINDNLKTIYFKETPIMSTYLLAFFVGETEYSESFANINNKQIKVRVYTPIGEKDKGIFARDLCSKVLEFFSDRLIIL